MEDRDLMVLGAGPGGYVAAIRAAQLGRKVTIVEQDALGGVCLNWGCIPTKALLRAAQLYTDMQDAEEFGFEVGSVKFDFPQVIKRSRQVAGKLSQGVQFLMRKNKAEVILGRGVLRTGNVLAVTDSNGKETSYKYRDIIIATGARPRVLPGMEVDGDRIHTSRTALEAKRMPEKLLVIGAGAIGIEFAYFFAALGAEVTVVEMVNQILPLEDREIADALRKVFEKRGMHIHTGAKVNDLKVNGQTVSANIDSGGKSEAWSGDTCLVAVGVAPNTEGLGLESAGIVLDRGFIKVNEYLATSAPHHYAIGDVVGGPLLAHVASHEALVAAETACGHQTHPMRYDNIPSCTYCLPQVASVGLTEQAVKEAGIKYKVGKIPFSAIGKAIAMGEPEGMLKVIVDQEVGEILGVHILHAEATELIAEAAVTRSHEGIAASVLDTVHPHPTLSEAMAEAMAIALDRPINF